MGLQSLWVVRGVEEASPQTDCLLNRQKLTAEMADSSNLIKALVIKADDARIVGDMKLMKRYYASTTSWLGSIHQAVQPPQGAAKCAQGGEPYDTASSMIKGRKCQ